MIQTSTPSLTTFDPTIIKSQFEALCLVRRDFDYSQGVLELMLSGSFGSAKSIILAHLAVTHCLMYPGARFGVFRRAMPDLKDTIYKKILEHIQPDMTENVHYKKNDTNASIRFLTEDGQVYSEIISRSWADKNYKKLRSLELSCGIFEELTENDSEEFTAVRKELFPRIGRLTHIPERFLIYATNPDGPQHSAYDHFISRPDKNSRVIYSVTSDNPFLPDNYVDEIRKGLTPQEVRRYIHGEWVEIKSEVIYYAYSPSHSFILSDYKINPRHPIRIAYDFNIGKNKPMSCVLYQYINGFFYFFDEVVIHGCRTADTLDEINARGHFDYPVKYIIRGDATGRHRDTRSIKSDYDIIEQYLANLYNKYGPIDYEIGVPRANPPVKTRHTKVNGQLMNDFGVTHVFIDKRCQTLDKGLRLTGLKDGGKYIEDDSKEYQHITTAMGYGIVADLKDDENNDGFVKRKI